MERFMDPKYDPGQEPSDSMEIVKMSPAKTADTVVALVTSHQRRLNCKVFCEHEIASIKQAIVEWKEAGGIIGVALTNKGAHILFDSVDEPMPSDEQQHDEFSQLSDVD